MTNNLLLTIHLIASGHVLQIDISGMQTNHVYQLQRAESNITNWTPYVPSVQPFQTRWFDGYDFISLNPYFYRLQDITIAK